MKPEDETDPELEGSEAAKLIQLMSMVMNQLESFQEKATRQMGEMQRSMEEMRDEIKAARGAVEEDTT